MALRHPEDRGCSFVGALLAGPPVRGLLLPFRHVVQRPWNTTTKNMHALRSSMEYIRTKHDSDEPAEGPRAVVIVSARTRNARF